MDEAEKLCDELLIIDHGKIIASGSPASLIKESFQETAVEFLDPDFSEEEKRELLELNLAERVNYETGKNRIILYTNEVSDTIKGLIDFASSKGKKLKDVMVRNPTLEDVFIKLTGRGIRE